MVQDHMTFMFMSEFKFSINAQFLRETKIIINRRLRRVLRDLSINFVPYNFIHTQQCTHVLQSRFDLSLRAFLVDRSIMLSSYRFINKSVETSENGCISRRHLCVFNFYYFQVAATFGQPKSSEQVLMTLVSLWQLSEAALRNVLCMRNCLAKAAAADRQTDDKQTHKFSFNNVKLMTPKMPGQALSTR